MEEQPLSSIGSYEFSSLIHSNDLSQIYYCYDKETGGKFALRVFDSRKAESENCFENLEILSHFSHQSIMPIYEKNLVGSYSYCVMPFILGGDLFNFIREGRYLSKEGIIYTMLQLSNAINHIHQRNFVHGNLRLENILIYHDEDPDSPHIVVTGFSHSQFKKIPCPITYRNDIYSAPEVEKTKELTQASDVYALGVIFYLLAKNIDTGGDQSTSFFQDKYFNDLLNGMIQDDEKERWTIRDCVYHPFFDEYLHDHGKGDDERTISNIVSQIDYALQQAEAFE